MTSSLKQSYERDGFLLVPDLITPSLFPELVAACDRAIARTRAGEWPHRRTVGKQFPPYGDSNIDSWGVQHIMHPELCEPVFARWYVSDDLVVVARELLGCEEEELQMELFNLLINPSTHEFALRWHRDDVKETATEQEERDALALWHHGVQWNTALYEDTCLYIVPGSHATPRTPQQRAHSETMQPPNDPMDMPGAVQVTLKPGESIFYNSNILHCATYTPYARRATLHATMGSTRGGTQRARNILQHGLGWMREERFMNGLAELGGVAGERATKMCRRLLEMERSVGRSDVGFSLSE